MALSKKTWTYLISFAVLVTGFYIFLFQFTDMTKSRLPVLNVVKPWQFIRQDNQPVSEGNVAGKVHVVEYFFTTCPGICPKMNTNMKQIAAEFKNTPDFLILSHTVDPDTDSTARLRFYADSLGADTKTWWFLTGSKKELYAAARESYILDDPNNNQGNIAEQFIHTQFFSLVDQQGQVRGVYDGLKKNELEKLKRDIRDLLDE